MATKKAAVPKKEATKKATTKKVVAKKKATPKEKAIKPPETIATTGFKVNLKPGDYSVTVGTIPIEFKRPVVINDEQSVITVKLSLNFKKNLFKVLPQLNNNQITGDSMLDAATRATLNALMDKAEEAGCEWRDARKKVTSEEAGGVSGMLKINF